MNTPLLNLLAFAFILGAATVIALAFLIFILELDALLWRRDEGDE